MNTSNKNISFIFQVHQPFRLKRYRFFDIGNDHYYFDDFQNEDIFRRIVEQSYIPANRLMLQLIKDTKHRFRVAYAISGVALEQIEMYAPELIDSFTELAETGCVEFLGETYAHSLASLAYDKDEFRTQVKEHAQKIELMFGQKPRVFRNSELLYDDAIGKWVHDMGFDGVITEGAKHILGWKSPNNLYKCATTPELKLLLRNSHLTEDISRNFTNYSWSEYPLTADKYAAWIAKDLQDGEVVNIDMSYDVLGSGNPADSGIFDFFRALPTYLEKEGIGFATPSESIKNLTPKDALTIPDTISWSEEEKNTNSWLGNTIQREAFNKIQQLAERTRLSQNRRLLQDWTYLQSSDHLYYMSSQGDDVKLFSPYDNEYEAFNNYMNVISDFHLRVDEQYPSSIENEELNALLITIQNQGDEIAELKQEIKQLEAEKGHSQKSSTKEKK